MPIIGEDVTQITVRDGKCGEIIAPFATRFIKFEWKREFMSVLRKTESTNAMTKTEMNFGNGEDARELQDSELEAVSGGASMVEYAILMGAVVAVTVAKRFSS